MRQPGLLSLIVLGLSSCTTIDPQLVNRTPDGRFMIDQRMICIDLMVEVLDSSNVVEIRRNPWYDADTIYSNVALDGRLADPCRPGTVTYRYRCGDRPPTTVVYTIPAQTMTARWPRYITANRDGVFDTTFSIQCCPGAAGLMHAVTPAGWHGRLVFIAVTPDPYECPGGGSIRVQGRLRQPQYDAAVDIRINGPEGAVTMPITIRATP